MKHEVLSRRLTELIAEYKAGKGALDAELQTTEANEEEQKPHETEDGIEWIVRRMLCVLLLQVQGRGILLYYL